VAGTKLALDASAADALLVTAAGDDSALGLFVVSARDATITPLEGLDGTRKIAEVFLRDVPATRIATATPHLIDALEDALLRIAVALACDAVGAADHALEIATEYAKVRRQFDRPIGAFQAIQHKLADMLRGVELSRAGVAEALRLADGSDRNAFRRAAAAAKAFASDALPRATADAIQVLGGIGFTWEHDAHLFYKRAMSMSLAFGGAAAHRRSYAGHLLDNGTKGSP
jgi:alkylation response protein AidB-like acyl-CoA dehydrogenase